MPRERVIVVSAGFDIVDEVEIVDFAFELVLCRSSGRFGAEWKTYSPLLRSSLSSISFSVIVTRVYRSLGIDIDWLTSVISGEEISTSSSPSTTSLYVSRYSFFHALTGIHILRSFAN